MAEVKDNKENSGNEEIAGDPEIKNEEIKDQKIESEEQGSAVHTSPCGNCGADLEFKPGTSSLNCPYCGAKNEIESVPSEEIVVEERDYEQALANLLASENSKESEEILVVKCETCGAEVSFDKNTVAGECAFCGAAINAQGVSKKSVKPEYLLPFKITKEKARENFKHWLKKRWFAPKKLKEFARVDGLKGIYSPFWTYDSNTDTDYTGRRGEYYYVTVSYTAYEDGEAVTRTRQERRTRWYSASGNVQNVFDDILIHGTSNMEEKYVDRLEPWDLDQLIPYNPSYLSGFKVESYSIGLEDGFDKAKDQMAPTINSTVKRDIGGDVQEINSTSTSYDDTKFKHILLPVWISSFKFKDKVYQFMVNARTGEVQGNRPWSVGKIILAILGGLLVIAGVIFTIITYF